jgi:DUF4097 and DUF4098 domain-containing protein YvlB
MKHRVLFVLSLILAAPAIADTPIDETRAVNADARIEISNVKGSVTVSGWDRAEVRISGTLGEGAKGLTVDGGGDHLRIKVESPGDEGWFNWGSSNRMRDSILDVKVPRGADLEIDTVSADVTVSGTAGERFGAETVSGKLRIASDAREVTIDSVSGEIDLSGKARRANLETVSGDVRARGVGGTMELESVSGNIDIEAGDFSDFGADSVSGDIHLRGSPAANARIRLESMSGDLDVVLPADASTRISAETFSGSIRSDFGASNESAHGPGKSLRTTVGGGAGQLHAETFSGDIEIRRQ